MFATIRTVGVHVHAQFISPNCDDLLGPISVFAGILLGERSRVRLNGRGKSNDNNCTVLTIQAKFQMQQQQYRGSLRRHTHTRLLELNTTT